MKQINEDTTASYENQLTKNLMGNIKRRFPNKTMRIGKTSSQDQQDQQRFPLLDSAAARLVKTVLGATYFPLDGIVPLQL